MKAKEQKKIEAIIRQEAYDKLSTVQKLAKLDTKLGIDVGAIKERKRLSNAL